MAHNRRTFLKGAGLTTAVVSAAPLSLALPGEPVASPGNASAAAAGPEPLAGRFALELDGQAAGIVAAFRGGNVVADVVEFTSGTDLIPRKSIGDLHYEEITIMAGFGMSAVFWDWVGQMVDGDSVRKNGAIVLADVDYNVVRRLEFQNALITEVGLPALDAASKDAGLLTIRFRPESTMLTPGSGKLTDASLAKPKPWLVSNFRLEVGTLPCSQVDKVEELTIKQKVVEYRDGTDGQVRLLPGKLEFPNLVPTFSALDAGPWLDFFEDFVIQGNNGQAEELGGNLELLAPDLKTVLARLQFFHLGIFRLAHEEVEPSTTDIRRFRADLYSEGNRLFVGGLTRA